MCNSQRGHKRKQLWTLFSQDVLDDLMKVEVQGEMVVTSGTATLTLASTNVRSQKFFRQFIPKVNFTELHFLSV